MFMLPYEGTPISWPISTDTNLFAKWLTYMETWWWVILYKEDHLVLEFESNLSMNGECLQLFVLKLFCCQVSFKY